MPSIFVSTKFLFLEASNLSEREVLSMLFFWLISVVFLKYWRTGEKGLIALLAWCRGGLGLSSRGCHCLQIVPWDLLLQLIPQDNILKPWSNSVAPLSKSPWHFQLLGIVNCVSRVFNPVVVNNVLFLCEIALEFQRLSLEACHQSQKFWLLVLCLKKKKGEQ